MDVCFLQGSDVDLSANNLIACSPANFDWATEPPQYITHLSRIKKHISTDPHLHSHDHCSTVSDVDFQNGVEGAR
jgi:hypothetical protein